MYPPPLFDLCVLIPAFNNFEGVKRIIDRFIIHENVSIYVSDDSDNNETSRQLSKYIQSLDKARIKYEKRQEVNGAVENWNSLFKHVDAWFYTFVHHDEYHLDTQFLKKVISIKHSEIDCLVLPFQVSNKYGVVRNVSSREQEGSFSLIRIFMPFFNFIGPTSALIIRSGIDPLFDNKLTWQVDTEWYFRVLSSSRGVLFISDSIIKSEFYANSITWSEIYDVKALKKKEINYLKGRYPTAVKRWLLYGWVISRIVLLSLGFSNYLNFYFKRFLNLILK